MKKTTFTLAAASLILVSYSASSADDARIRLATTTSTYDSGLLDYLLPKFEQDTGYKVDVIATGTGKALKMGENGDVDLVMTHAPKAEASFVEAG
ncbi:substrate-binding domain-containing protein, partial [Vibrio cholerae]